jgi:glycosyltransferase involved in cell wall biosynthesis
VPTLRIGLVGPDRTQPCGIADYTARLAAALSGRCDPVFAPFRDALSDSRLEGCAGILVQYERSLMPKGMDGGAFLGRLAARHPGRVFVVPHEVYGEDPFAFPYGKIRSPFPPLLWLKRIFYRWRHRAYAAEKRLQALGYRAHRVLPLSGPGADILRGLGARNVLDPIPLAYLDPAERSGDPDSAAAWIPSRETLFAIRPKAVLGIFGFLNPGLDYASVLDALAGLEPGACLLILGGPRPRGAPDGTEAPTGNAEPAAASKPADPSRSDALLREASARGLEGRVRVTGYLPERSLPDYLRLCDLFVCPMRFKSNSSSLVNLLPYGKPILASDLPLTRYLVEQGALLELYSGAGELREKIGAAAASERTPKPNGYPWDFGRVAEAYLRILSGTEASPQRR